MLQLDLPLQSGFQLQQLVRLNLFCEFKLFGHRCISSPVTIIISNFSNNCRRARASSSSVRAWIVRYIRFTGAYSSITDAVVPQICGRHIGKGPRAIRIKSLYEYLWLLLFKRQHFVHRVFITSSDATIIFSTILATSRYNFSPSARFAGDEGCDMRFQSHFSNRRPPY